MEPKEKILQKAESLFMRYGIRSITMDDIAKELAISKKTIYQYFKDKDEVVCIITESRFLAQIATIEELERQAANAIEAVVKINAFLKKEFTGINPAMIYDTEKYHSNAWAIHEKYQDSLVANILKRNLSRGIEEGLYQKDLNLDLMVALDMAQMKLIMDEKIFPRDKFDFLELNLTLTKHFVRGIVTRKGFEQLEKYDNEFAKTEADS